MVRKLAPLLIVPALALVALGFAPQERPESEALVERALARGNPPELLIRPLSKAAAIDTNRAIPFSTDPNVPASPFDLRGDDEARDRAVECLASAILYEAGSESVEGQQAVAQVVLNRVRHPAFPDSICDVVFQGFMRSTGCQFTFTCDGSLMRRPEPHAWARARTIAEQALAGSVYAPVGWSTHYHANYVVPYWAISLAKATQVGLHIFYRWPQGSGRPSAFRQAYAKRELDPRSLRAASLMARGLWRSPAERPDDVVDVAPDARLELAGVLSLLSGARGRAESSYEVRVRTYFASQARHPAVEYLRQRAAGGAPVALVPLAAADLMTKASFAAQPLPPAAPQSAPAVASLDFAGAVRDFAERSGFERFFRTQRSYYNKESVEVARVAAAAAQDWEVYTGVPVEARKATIALPTSDVARGCLPAELRAPRRMLVWQHAGQSTRSRVFAASGLASSLFDARGGRGKVRRRIEVPQHVESALVSALFARIDVLAGRRAADRGEDGQLQALFAHRLRSYEKSRDRYPTLRDFLPALLAGVKLDEANESSADARGSACANGGPGGA